MKIVGCHLENFASYEVLDFKFDGQGLTLIHGATGSGKSTLCDAIPWILFGVTAKGGKVDEILSWPGDKTTKGMLTFADGSIVSRVRGSKAKDNDLTFSFSENSSTRGRDLVDTQRIINLRFGLDAELYLAGAYFHEFSQTAQFFTTTPKNRRAICENIVDLKMAKDLQVKISASRKTKESAFRSGEVNVTSLKAQIIGFEEMLTSIEERRTSWAKSQKSKLSEAQKKLDNYEDDKAEQISAIRCNLEQIVIPEGLDQKLFDLNLKFKSLSLEPCQECGAPKNCKERDAFLRQIRHTEQLLHDRKIAQGTAASLLAQIERLNKEVSPYSERLEYLRAEKNPHILAVKDAQHHIDKTAAELEDAEKSLLSARIDIEDLGILVEVLAAFRSTLVRNTILEAETQTNRLLTTHFDAEIRVEFSVLDDDKLEVTILKNGNECTYTQLSKGQRQLLKLCFGVAVMGCVANHSGINFEQIFLDESLDGLDDSFKAKAFGLLQSLEGQYDSIFVVEHSSDFKSRFTNQFEVVLDVGGSHVQA